MFQVNYLCHFLLCNRLLKLLLRNRPSRIIVTGNALHSWHPIDWDDIMMARRPYDKILQFSRTTLMSHLMTFALHRRLQLLLGTHLTLTANVVDPGPGDLRLTRSSLTASETALPTAAYLTKSSAWAVIFLIESAQLTRVSGKYFDGHGRQTRSGSIVTDVRLQERLWEFSVNLLGKYGIHLSSDCVNGTA